MAEPKRRDKPKGAEIREKQKKPVRALTDRFTEQDSKAAEGALGALGAESVAADIAGSVEPYRSYLSRREFSPGFYTQKDKPPVDAETMFGKGTKRGFEYPTVDPDTRMVQDAQGMAEGGSVRGQKNIQVKKKVFKGVF